MGVLHRIDSLADRPVGYRPQQPDQYHSAVALPEILSEIEGVGPNSKRVQRSYEGILARTGPELEILERLPLPDVERGAGPVVAEAVGRMRTGRVIRQAGFDGQYGSIRLFEPEELE